MTLLSTSSHLIKVGQDYSAGNGISIDDHVISVTGGTGTTYSAGDNINIYEQDEQLYISSKDWTNDIANASANAYNAATAQIPEPQDLSYISSKVDDKLDSTAFTNWQTGQYTTDLQTIEGQITNKLDTSSFSEVSASFLTAINIPESATWNEVSQAYEQSSATYLTSVSIPESATWQDVSTTVQSNSAQWADGGSGDEEVNSFVYNNSATINEVNTAYQTHSASYLTAHQDISNKLNTTAFSTVSGDFLTAAPADMATTGDIAELAQSVSETYQVKGDYVERNTVYSAIESATSGKLDVSSFASVSSDFLTTSFGISESAGWNESTNVVQTNSANWGNETISSYTTATIEGTNAINSLNGKPIISFRAASAQEAGVADKARYDFNGNNLSDDHNSLTALNNYVQTNSANWGSGSIPVSNSGDLYQVEFDGIDLYGYKSTTTIPNHYSVVSSQETTHLQHTPYPQWNNPAVENLNNWSSVDIISVSSTGVQIYPPEAGDYGYLTALNVYYQARYVFDSNNNQLPDFSGYVGQITLDNLLISSYFDKPSYFNDIGRVNQFRLWFSGNQHEGDLNNKYICSVGKIGTGTIEGIFVPSSTDLSNYYTKSETSGASEIADALPIYEYDNTNKISAINGSAIAAGDEFPASANEAITAYQNNSATYLTAHQAISAEEWNNCYNNVNTNSGAWGGSALPISAGPGIKVNLVDNTLVFSNDETVLYSATPKNYGGESSGESITLSENISNFERLRFYINVMKGPNSPVYYESYEVDNYLGTACNFQYGPYPENNVTANWFILRAWATNNICNISAAYNAYTAAQEPYWGNKWFPGSVYKIVGINRK